MRTAAIDCGTNSIRLLIADIDDDGVLTDVVRLMRVVRLGEGVDATGRLSAPALERTFAAAEDYARLISEHRAERVRFVATSATRDAANRADFVAGIRDRLHVELEIISGAEEAALSFAGAASVLAPGPDDVILVVDLGGGSTEFVTGNAGGVIAAHSLDMGCVRFTERFLRSDPPTHTQVAATRREVDALIAEAARVVPLERITALVGVAGSITTITAHALSLPEYLPERIHGARLAVADIRSATKDLLRMSRQERAALPYMHPGRTDVIGAGALIWQSVVEHTERSTAGRVQTATTSEHDILDGIALSTASGK